MRRVAVCVAILLTAAIGADRGLAGKYVGEWKSSGSDIGGSVRFSLDGPNAETWKCDLTFALNGADVKTTMREVKVQNTKIELTYDFDAGGTTLRSHITGNWDGTTFKGNYDTTAGGVPIDNGTWTAVRDKNQ